MDGYGAFLLVAILGFVIITAIALAGFRELDPGPEVRKAMNDAEFYGSGFIRQGDDGELERVSPDRVRVIWADD
jgi:hypothetical protein